MRGRTGTLNGNVI